MSATTIESALRVLIHYRNVHNNPSRKASVRAMIHQDIQRLRKARMQ